MSEAPRGEILDPSQEGVERIKDGVFITPETRTLDEKFGGKHVLTYPYVIPMSGIGHIEAEDLVARLLEARLQNDRFVGLSWDELRERVVKDMEAQVKTDQKIGSILNRQNTALDNGKGLRGLIKKLRKAVGQTLPDEHALAEVDKELESAERERHSLPRSPLATACIYSTSKDPLDPLVHEIRDLEKKGFLKVITITTENKSIDIILLTEKAMETLIKTNRGRAHLFEGSIHMPEYFPDKAA